jgi:recombination protein RecT
MSNYEDYANQCRQLVNKAQPRFNSIVADTAGSLLFKTEAVYAMHAMLNNEFLAKTAFNNPVSLDLALAQIAACGLTLDPAMQLAYLVPRDGKVLADISYRGLIDIAIRSRAVNLVTVKAVYANDIFRFRGDHAQPEHVYDPFMPVEDRGELRGTYSVAHLAIGMLLVTPVRAEDIYAARSLSMAWARGKTGSKGPWESHFEAMALKTCVKITRKYWPMSSPVLEQAIAYLNEDGGEGFAGGPVTMDMAANLVSGGNAAQGGQAGDVAVDGDIIDISQARPTPQGDSQSQQAPATTRTTQPSRAPQGTATVTQLEPRAGSLDAGAGDGSPSNLTEQMRERIDSVMQRTQRARSWKACEDWMSSNLKGDCAVYAQEKFQEIYAAAQQSQGAVVG